jgi:hypothetical protein
MKTTTLFVRAFALSLLLVVSKAGAIIPENGWWWINGVTGTGFNIEIQNNLLFFATFGYDNVGNPVWYTAGGAMTSDRNYSSTLYRTSAGSCIGCPYVAPTVTAVGPISLQFTSSQSANLTFNGVTVAVSRFNFWFNDTVPDAMFGEWSMVVGEPSLPVYFGERVILRTRSATNGLALNGFRTGSNRVAVALYDQPSARWGILVDSSTSYYEFYVFNTTGFNRIEGQNYTYLKTSSPTGSGLFFLGHRTKSYNFVLNGTGPGESKSALSPEEEERELEARSATKAKAMASDVATDPSIVELAKQLESVLRSVPK